MAKIKAKEVIVKVKAKEKSVETANITFRLPKSLINNFKKMCEAQNVSANSIAQELLEQFTSDQ